MLSTPWLVFILSCIGFGFIPGPAMLQTISVTWQGGRRAGVLAALGILLGGIFQVVIVALGAAALLKASPAAYGVMKAAGGAYLIWLGIQRMSAPIVIEASAGLSRQILWSSALVEATNPKSALFYLSFLLPFSDPGASLAVGWQLFGLGMAANLLFSVADLLIVLMAHPLRARLLARGPGYRWAQRVAGLLFILMGAFAILSD